MDERSPPHLIISLVKAGVEFEGSCATLRAASGVFRFQPSD